eukprot:7486489-Pyramimonas_sp.AAC.1
MVDAVLARYWAAAVVENEALLTREAAHTMPTTQTIDAREARLPPAHELRPLPPASAERASIKNQLVHPTVAPQLKHAWLFPGQGRMR